MRYFSNRQSGSIFKDWAPGILLLLAVCMLALAFFGDESQLRMHELEAELINQRGENARVKEHVNDMRTKIVGLQKDDRVLEKTARNELGMLRSNEVMFIFKDEEK